MSKELICPKCGKTYMGDPWVDDSCESCRQPPSEMNATVSNRKAEEAPAAERTPIAQDPKVLRNTRENTNHQADRASRIPNHPKNRNYSEEASEIPSNAEGNSRGSKDAFTWLRKQIISIDIIGLKRLFKDYIFLGSFLCFCFAVISRHGRFFARGIDSLSEATVTALFYIIIWLIVFNCFLLRNKKLLIPSIASAIISLFLLGPLKSELGYGIPTNPSQTFIAGLIDFGCWYVLFAIYYFINRNIRHKTSGYAEMISMCVGSASIMAFWSIVHFAEFVEQYSDRNLAYNVVMTSIIVRCLTASSLAVMSTNFLQTALVSSKRKNESFCIAVFIAVAGIFLNKYSPDGGTSIVGLVSFVLLFGYLSRWGIYPLKLKASYKGMAHAESSQVQNKPETGKFCPQCGAPQLPTAKFCSKCGGRLSS